MSDTCTLDIELFVDLDNKWEEYHLYKNIAPLNNGVFNELPLKICRDELILSKLIPIIDNELSIENRNSNFIWVIIDLTEDEFLYIDLKYEIPQKYKKETECSSLRIKI